ncbi:uncharacterized protein LACBIDRAFT_301153 [Laccaria bicolor S238N-H82]|uniref:Predicted protein n=1 Tax=Laccaria bicolor (strain S238N-H82 / ATCC MYA-4686) TaxID=486041 RepID=B0CRG7_LACBS|nr:uncharacterized protein LACBIDRAFT_301153 [Laccaria bicolor S238N-H82]EDR15199.1 predicted protein [Laccaria bicolor S238N-H82]|eukprot:XP_001873407.1 predicted protein [Laccaria bicolor S238N-H82]
MGDFDMTVGVLLLGLFFNTYLYGLVTYQFVVYHNTKFNDPLWIRAVVGILFVTDTLHSAVAVYAAWDLCVTNYANPGVLGFVDWTIPFTAIATSVAAIVTQFFLAHRVLLLTKNKIIVAIIGTLSFLGFVFGIYAGVRSGIIKEVKNFAPLTPFVICWLGFQTGADLLITVVLTFVLSRSRTGFQKTDSMINRLIRGAIQTGLFASIFALADLFSFLLHRETNLYAMFAFPIGRIYTNTLLDTLNARIDLKSKNTTLDLDSEHTNAYRLQNQSQTLGTQSHTMHSIHVKRETVTDTSPPPEHSIDAKYVVDDSEVYAHPSQRV